MEIERKKVLWLDDQYEDFQAQLSDFLMAGYIIDSVESVSAVLEKLNNEEDYIAIILDMKVLPGEDSTWKKLDDKMRGGDPDIEPILGIELLRSLFSPNTAEIKIDLKNPINPNKIIVYSVINDITEEIKSFGIPCNQIIEKSSGFLKTLTDLLIQVDINTSSE